MASGNITVTISTINPDAWVCPETGEVFTSRIHAENYATQNNVELVPLYREPAMPFLDRLQELLDGGAYVIKMDDYVLFDSSGDIIIASGQTVLELMANIPPR